MEQNIMNIEQMADEIQAESRAKFKRRRALPERRLIDPAAIEQIKQRRSVPRETLSKRQSQVLKLFCAGLNAKSAAAEVGLGTNAINKTRRKLFEITGVKNDAQLGVWAVRNGIVE
jgi:DNA-binding NarL/FixJ family response regulator